MGGFGDSLMKRGASIRRSLKLGTKKDKTCKQEPLGPVSEGSVEEKEEKEEEEEVVWEEVEEAYTLPEIPQTPLSGTVSLICVFLPYFPRKGLLMWRAGRPQITFPLAAIAVFSYCNMLMFSTVYL